MGTENFSLLTASSGEMSTSSTARPSAMHKSGDGGRDGCAPARAGEDQHEIQAISDYLATCKSRLLKEHRNRQEAEWQANKQRTERYLEEYRSKKRRLSLSGTCSNETGADLSVPGTLDVDHAGLESATKTAPDADFASMSNLQKDPAAFIYEGLYLAPEAAAVEGGVQAGLETDPRELLSISADGSAAVLRQSNRLTAVIQGHPPDRATSRVTYVLGREHSGDVDFGVVTPDGMHGIFYLGRTGEIASLSADKTHNGRFRWVAEGKRHPWGPKLQHKDEISVELSLGTQPRARPPETSTVKWAEANAAALVPPQSCVEKAPYTIPHTFSTLSIFINGEPISAPYPWEPHGGDQGKAGRGGGGGCFAVIFHEEGDSVEIKSHSWQSVPTFFPVPLPTTNIDAENMGGGAGAGASKTPLSLYSLEGAAPYYAGMGPGSFSGDQCCYSVHQGAIGGKLIQRVQPVTVTSVDDVPSHMSWTAIIKNTVVEDDPVLTVIPYFGDDDREGVDLSLYKEDKTAEEEHDPVHDALILECGDKYQLTATALTAITEMLRRTSAYVTERYQTLCSERQELRDKQSKERDAASAASLASRKGRGGLSGVGLGAIGELECKGLETYTAMFCRRCFKYDCHFHGIYHPQSRMKDSPTGRPPERRAAARAAAAAAAAVVVADEDKSDRDCKTEEGVNTSEEPKVQPSGVLDLISALGAAAAGALNGLTKEGGEDAQGKADSMPKKCDVDDEGEQENVPLPGFTPLEVLNNTMKVLNSDAAAKVADAAIPPWTPAERQLANKANCIFDGDVDAISALIPTRTRTQICAYVAALPRLQVQRASTAPVLPPLKEGSATQKDGPSGQTSYTRPFGSRGSKSKKNKHEQTEQTRAMLRKQERLGVKHEYRPCTCALRGIPCAPETCECIKSNNFCEKYCACSGPLGGCGNGFPGCGCRKTECRSVGCPCWDAFRECDVDVCTCGASGMLEEFDRCFEANTLDDKNKVWGSEFFNNPAACWRHRYDRHLPARLFTKRPHEGPAAAGAVGGDRGAARSAEAAHGGVDKKGVEGAVGGSDKSNGKEACNGKEIDDGMEASTGGDAASAQDPHKASKRRDMTGRKEWPEWSQPDPKLMCANINIQMRRHQHLYMGKSDVAGWGVFTRDTVEKNEFIQEYTGEQMSQEEADRRGRIYDKRNSSYIFNLNNQTVLDAMRKGNKTRFANHSNTPNCFAKILLVRGDHRIGIFAKRRAEAGDELLYDYHHENHDVVPEWHQELKPKAGDPRVAKRKHSSS